MAYTREIEKLERAYRENPDSRRFAPLADAYRKAGEIERAIELVRAGLEKHPDYLSAHIVLGRCLVDHADDLGARAAFEHVLSLDSENIIALRGLSDIAERASQPEEAVRWLEQLLDIDPMNDGGREALDRVQASLSAAEAATVETEATIHEQIVEAASEPIRPEPEPPTPEEAAGAADPIPTVESEAAEFAAAVEDTPRLDLAAPSESLTEPAPPPPEARSAAPDPDPLEGEARDWAEMIAPTADAAFEVAPASPDDVGTSESAPAEREPAAAEPEPVAPLDESLELEVYDGDMTLAGEAADTGDLGIVKAEDIELDAGFRPSAGAFSPEPSEKDDIDTRETTPAGGDMGVEGIERVSSAFDFTGSIGESPDLGLEGVERPGSYGTGAEPEEPVIEEVGTPKPASAGASDSLDDADTLDEPDVELPSGATGPSENAEGPLVDEHGDLDLESESPLIQAEKPAWDISSSAENDDTTEAMLPALESVAETPVQVPPEYQTVPEPEEAEPSEEVESVGAVESATDPEMPEDVEVSEVGAAAEWTDPDTDERETGDRRLSDLPLILPDPEADGGEDLDELQVPITAQLFEQDAAAADRDALDESEPVLTETMADLYASQGHLEEARRVYRAILATRPHDRSLKQKLENLATSARGPQPGEESVGQLFQRLVTSRPLPVSPTPHEGGRYEPGLAAPDDERAAPRESGTASSTLADVFDDPGETSERIPGEPTREALDSLTLDEVFGGGHHDEKPKTPPTRPGGSGVSFDQFFGGDDQSSSSASSDDDDDLDQFHAWLKGLKT